MNRNDSVLILLNASPTSDPIRHCLLWTSVPLASRHLLPAPAPSLLLCPLWGPPPLTVAPRLALLSLSLGECSHTLASNTHSTVVFQTTPSSPGFSPELQTGRSHCFLSTSLWTAHQPPALMVSRPELRSSANLLFGCALRSSSPALLPPANLISWMLAASALTYQAHPSTHLPPGSPRDLP